MSPVLNTVCLHEMHNRRKSDIKARACLSVCFDAWDNWNAVNGWVTNSVCFDCFRNLWEWSKQSQMELGHPDLVCPSLCVCVCMRHLFQGTIWVLTTCFVGDSLYAFVFVGMYVCMDKGSVVGWSESCCWHLPVVLLMFTSKLECCYFSKHNMCHTEVEFGPERWKKRADRAKTWRTVGGMIRSLLDKLMALL